MKEKKRNTNIAIATTTSLKGATPQCIGQIHELILCNFYAKLTVCPIPDAAAISRTTESGMTDVTAVPTT